MKKISLHVQILISLVLGVLCALASVKLGWPSSAFIFDYIEPFGQIFLNSLKAIAIPLIIASLVVGVTNIEDVSKLSRIGLKTIALYLVTTMLAVVMGLGLVNVFKPGALIPTQTRIKLISLYATQSEQSALSAQELKGSSPLQFLVDMVPENFFQALTNNLNLLQIVIISIIFGIALTRISQRKSKMITLFFEGCNDALLEIIRMIMKIAPLGVFALISSLLVKLVSGGNTEEIFEILYALLFYVVLVVIGLACMTFIIYPLILRIFTKVKYLDFIKGMRPAQLVAFSTSSSSATLPITMERVEKHLGVSEEISSFVLPLGATVNMDGSALYQGISIVFIAQALGIPLSFGSQCLIVLNVTLSSIGTAGVPGASIVMTTMVLGSLGIPLEGLALIIAPERILDMLRTVTNITGDAAVAVVVASSEGELAEGADSKLLENE